MKKINKRILKKREITSNINKTATETVEIKTEQPDIVFGEYEASGICLSEALIDNLVLRIPIRDCKDIIDKNNVLKKSRISSKDKKKTPIPEKTPCKVKARNNFMSGLGLRETKECKNETNKSALDKINNRTRKQKMKSSKDLKNTLKKNLSLIIDSPTNNGVFTSSEELIKERTAIIRKTTPKQYKKLPKNQRHYFLQLPTTIPGEESRFNYDFHLLMNSLQLMKLPSRDWKIKVMLKQNNVYSIVITNAQVFERSLTFYSQSVLYNIMIDNLAVVLIGSPKTVDSIQDIEILLDIIEHINLSDPMVKIK